MQLPVAIDEDEVLAKMHQSYTWSGLVRKESKAVTKAQSTEVWGVEFDGTRKTVGVSMRNSASPTCPYHRAPCTPPT
eukprot:3904752-Amphidinium_carterae.2